MSRNSILSQYGRRGITTFSLDRQGKALISDDTQMTLFTANGLYLVLRADTRMVLRVHPSHTFVSLIWIGITHKVVAQTLNSNHTRGFTLCLN